MDMEVNSKSVLAMRAIGKGRTALESFCGLMGMFLLSQSESTLRIIRYCMIHPRKREGLICCCCCWASHRCIWGWCYWHYRHLWWYLGQTRFPVPLRCCCSSFLGYRKSFGCVSSQQTLPGLCSSSRHGRVVWWILRLVGGASVIL